MELYKSLYGGGTTTIETSVKFRNFVEQYLLALFARKLPYFKAQLPPAAVSIDIRLSKVEKAVEGSIKVMFSLALIVPIRTCQTYHWVRMHVGGE